MKKLTIIHTTVATVLSMPSMIQKMYPDQFEIVNVLDDSMLNEIKAKGDLTKEVTERFVQYAVIAKNNGSDAILLACSSIGRAGDIARNILDIPLFKIDEPMAEEAVKSAEKILILGTVKSTLRPTTELIESKKKTGQIIESIWIPDVFELYTENNAEHDRRIAEMIGQHQAEYDVVVLAQASMSGAADWVTKKKAQILTSLPMGLYQLKKIIEE